MSASRTEARAAAWLLRREEPGWAASDEAELAAWLEESMAHKAAFWRLEHGWSRADWLGELELQPLSRPLAKSWLPRWQTVTALAASLLLAVCSTLAWKFGIMSDRLVPVQVRTDLGNHSAVPLADGSRLELNTATQERVAVSPRQREIWLDHGEVYFDVRHMTDTPFVIHAGAREVRVLGTKFAVRRDGDRIQVAVVEGAVQLDHTDQPGPGDSAVIPAGRIAYADRASTLVVARPIAEIRNGLEWREGLLVFDHLSLAQAAAEFNRYNRVQLVIADPEVAAIRIGGTFRSDNVEGFSQLLVSAYGFRIERKDQKIIVTDKAASP